MESSQAYMMEVESVPETLFDFLPWQDIIFRYVFPHLPLQSLFHLRVVSSQCKECITEYFISHSVITFPEMEPRHGPGVFKILTRDSYLLKVLNLRHTGGWLTDKLLLSVLENNAKLVKVDLSNCMSLTNACIQKLAIHCDQIKEVDLRDCHWVSRDAVLVMAMNCSQLQRLDLTGCWEIDDDSVINLTRFCKDLRFLAVAKIYGLTDRSITHLAKHCATLQHLNLKGCWRVTDQSVRLLGEYCKKLRVLQVRECRNITEASLARVRLKGVKVDVPQHPYTMNPEFAKFLQELKLQI